MLMREYKTVTKPIKHGKDKRKTVIRMPAF
jgi:hypothetical protein